VKKKEVKSEGISATMKSFAKNADKPCECGNPRYRNGKGEVASNKCYECHMEQKRRIQRKYRGK
jgi:hypothetical protein